MLKLIWKLNFENQENKAANRGHKLESKANKCENRANKLEGKANKSQKLQVTTPGAVNAQFYIFRPFGMFLQHVVKDVEGWTTHHGAILNMQ